MEKALNVKYVQINSVPNLSTGTIMNQIAKERRALGDECWTMWGRGREAQNDYEFNFGSKLGFYLDVVQTRIDGRAGFHSKAATRRLLAKLDEIDPDVVHLHNIHGYYVNVEALFAWLATHNCRVKWTLHDCWAFTGHCSYFTYVDCDEWKTHCAHDGVCCQRRSYPATFSKSACSTNFNEKMRIFNSIPKERMQLIVPSQWLADLVKESFLSGFDVEVRHNVVDPLVFKPTLSNFREKYDLEGKFVVLGVASPWSERKGLNDFMRLGGELDDSFAVVLVGLSCNQIDDLPQEGSVRYVGIGRTESKEELAAIYSAANLFFNPTKEDNFPTVNLESESCGTPVVTYDSGGCCETISMGDSVCLKGFDEALKAIKRRKDNWIHQES